MEDISKYINKESILRAIQYKPISRAEWIKRFYVKLNEGRYEQDRMSLGRVGKHLKKWGRLELAGLWADCEDSKNFQSRFWWRYGMVKFIKIKKPKQRSLL
jgi:hypothetical protein